MVQILINCTKSKIKNIGSAYPNSILRMVQELHLYTCGLLSIKYSTQDDSNKNKPPEKINETKIPEPPTNCCMSGCANCVWIEYAEKLTTLFKDGGERAQKEIMDSVTDPNMRAFLMSELRSMKFKK